MRILHAPQNIAGQASSISRAQRSLGFKSDVLTFYSTFFDYETDMNLNLNKKLFIEIAVLRIFYFLICIRKYDVFHFHFASSFLPRNADLPILKLLGKKVFMEYWGSDVIQGDIGINYYLLTIKDFKNIFPATSNDQKLRKKINRIDKYVNASIVGDYSLLPFSPKSVVIRQAIDLSKLPFIGCNKENDTIKIVHAPTNRNKKGTNYIFSTIKKLKEEGYKIEFILVEKKTNRETLEIFKTADIIIDDVLMGPYGIICIECMALGKPVLCRIDDKLIKYYHNLPIVNTPPDKIYENIKLLIDNPKLRKELGISGRKYVKENHDSIKIAQQLIDLYSV